MGLELIEGIGDTIGTAKKSLWSNLGVTENPPVPDGGYTVKVFRDGTNIGHYTHEDESIAFAGALGSAELSLVEYLAGPSYTVSLEGKFEVAVSKGRVTQVAGSRGAVAASGPAPRGYDPQSSTDLI
jgi:hypothetical protein